MFIVVHKKGKRVNKLNLKGDLYLVFPKQPYLYFFILFFMLSLIEQTARETTFDFNQPIEIFTCYGTFHEHVSHCLLYSKFSSLKSYYNLTFKHLINYLYSLCLLLAVYGRVNIYKNDFMSSKARHIDFEILNTSVYVFYKLAHKWLKCFRIHKLARRWTELVANLQSFIATLSLSLVTPDKVIMMTASAKRKQSYNRLLP